MSVDGKDVGKEVGRVDEARQGEIQDGGIVGWSSP